MLNGEVWVAGGLEGRGNPTSRVEIFNISSQTWRVGRSLNYPRMGLTMEAVDSELIVFGGWEDHQDQWKHIKMELGLTLKKLWNIIVVRQ